MRSSYRASSYQYRPMGSRRSGRRTAGIAAAGVAGVAALAYGAWEIQAGADEGITTLADGTEITVPTASPEEVIVVVVGNSESDLALRPKLQQQLATVAAVAERRRARLEVVALDARTDTNVEQLGSADFVGACAGIDNRECHVDRSVTDTLLDQVDEQLADLPPAPETDVPGLLVHMTRRRREVPAETPVTVVMLSDGISSSPRCDFGLVPLDPATFPDTAQRCLAGLDVDLAGTRLVMAGIGQSNDPDMDQAVLRATPGLLDALVEAAHGVPVEINLDAGAGSLLNLLDT